MSDRTDNRFVAHFDMLGMSALTKRDPDLAWKKLSALHCAREKRLSLGIERLDNNELIQDQVRSFMFSDTIIAYSKADSVNDALAIVLLTTEMFTLASLHYGVPLRGGIAHGRFKSNTELNLFAGPALIDAFELGESSQWLGIVLDECVAETFSQHPYIKSARCKDVVVPWDVPCKGGTRLRQMVVNWPETHRETYRGPVPLTLGAFYQTFAEIFGPIEEQQDSIKAKYANTVAFFNAHFGS